MSKINPCFKGIFVFFNVLFVILGAVILGLGLLAQIQLTEEVRDKYSVVIVLVVVGSVIFILSFLGAYGAQKENKNVLIAFFVIMCMGTIVLLRLAVPVAISRGEMNPMIQKEFQKSVPLDQTNPDFKNVLEYIQKEANCCGLVNGYQDWGSKVPASCDCVDTDLDRCQRIIIRESHFEVNENRRVYAQPCGPIILEYVNTAQSITLGILFGFGALAMLAAVMSLVMIIRVTAPTASPLPIFALNYKPPKYSELVPAA